MIAAELSRSVPSGAAIPTSMPETLQGVDADRLERSCRSDSIRFGPSAHGIERAEVHLSACAFEPHRHDTYAIGVTTAGVQTFRYRGAGRTCLPGELHVLHPDELHDGAPGTEAGFGYRILYIAPELVHAALDGAPLPFVRDPVHRSTPSTFELLSALAHIEEPISDLRRIEIAQIVADALQVLTGSERRCEPIDMRAVETAREFLAEHAREHASAATLEQVTGLDRYTLARQFRRAYGTSPDRYRTMRRLEHARRAIERGDSLARVAAGNGFADQSHLTRQFKRAYGFTPARWAVVTAA
jgi:AraC-like DNA-binding protein